jgi:4-amino-4-deoxy-L-arabinose transferase-like glycosyltransferase
MTRRSFWLILLALAVVRLALMATIPVFEPSEARYAAISANMARSGDFVVPRFTHNLEYQSFDGKPPLVFQAGGLFVKALGTDAPWKLQLAVRLFPFLSAVLMLVILYFAVARLSGPGTGRLAVAMCATSTAFYAASGIAMTDMTLTCCVAGALLLYRTFADTRSLASAAGVAALLGAGMITKGPVALALFGLPVLADAILHRRWSAVFSWKWLAVAPVFLVIAVPWFVLVEQRNPGSVWYFFYNENFLRFVSHDYGDKYGAGREAFRGVSILWALVSVMPWTFVPFGRGAWLVWKNRELGLRKCLGEIERRANLSGFFFVSCLVIVGFWCLTSRVLIYYLFPVIPLAAAWYALQGTREVLLRLVAPYAALTVTVLVLGFAGGAMFSDKMRGEDTPFGVFEKNYAYEFYHGRMSEEELAPYRSQREEFLRRLTEWEKAHPEAKRKGENRK